ncbi:FAD-dependent oxidoreductase [Shigella sonnei]
MESVIKMSRPAGDKYIEVMMSTEIKPVVVLGAGPAGYSAAFRCADLGLETGIVERTTPWPCRLTSAVSLLKHCCT